ncbi:hypothetical protein BT69DRAFT_1317097 [Atractiella rhizophila]|nr:hypothetical protein BT69DRAFT_1317097 [Atractiella rhizophila]
MPVLKRKQVALIPPPAALNSVPPDHPVWYIEATGEIFLQYEQFAKRMLHLRRPIFQCSFSGKLGLSYFEALESEKKESKIVNDRFVEELKGPVLRRVQWQVCGRLDTLVDRVYDRFKDRYWPGETVAVELGGERYLCEIVKVTPPPNVKSHFSAISLPQLPPNTSSPSTSSRKVVDNTDYRSIIHLLGTDLDLDLNTIKRIDDPAVYAYSVRVLSSEKNPDKDRYSGMESEVGNVSLSRDRTAFSKAIIKRFLKECLTRNSAVGSPWVVTPELAREHGVKTEETDELKDKLRKAREGKLEKRKKTWAENKDVKRRKGESGEAIPVETKKKTAAGGKGKGKGKGKKVEEEQEPMEVEIPVEKASPKKVKYPIEDLDLDPMSIFDGRLLRRQSDLPTLPTKPSLHKNFLGVPSDMIDSLMLVYNFVNIYGRPLQISPFTLDDFISSLLHTDSYTSCPLVAEVHAVLLNQIINESLRVPGSQYSARLRLGGDITPTPIQRNIKRAIELTKNWDRTKLKADKDREGWEKALLGCLLQRGGFEKVGEMERIVRHFALSDADIKMGLDQSQSRLSASAPDTVLSQLSQLSDEDSPDMWDRYVSMGIREKISVLVFLVDLVVGYGKMVRSHIEETEGTLTEMRKEKVEWGRERKRLLVDKPDGKVDPNANTANSKPSKANGHPKIPKPANSSKVPSTAPSTSQLSNTSSALSQLSEPDDEEEAEEEIDELASSSDEAAPVTGSATLEAIKAKQKASEVEESLTVLSKKEEAWERDFRRCYHIPRTRPLGQDRFYNTYWWFDGLGGTEKTVPTATGRLMVQGPTRADWFMMCEKQMGEEQVVGRLRKETGNDAAILSNGEWGWLETEEEFDELFLWLNNKGNREHNLRTQLLKWRNGILASASRRQASTLRQSDITIASASIPRCPSSLLFGFVPDPSFLGPREPFEASSGDTSEHENNQQRE